MWLIRHWSVHYEVYLFVCSRKVTHLHRPVTLLVTLAATQGNMVPYLPYRAASTKRFISSVPFHKADSAALKIWLHTSVFPGRAIKPPKCNLFHFQMNLFLSISSSCSSTFVFGLWYLIFVTLRPRLLLSLSLLILVDIKELTDVYIAWYKYCATRRNPFPTFSFPNTKEV